MCRPSESGSPPRRRLGPAQRRGSVLALTLALIVLLGFITIAFVEAATEKIVYDAQFQHHEDLRAEAYSAHEVVLAILNVFHELDGALWGPEQGWADPLAMAEDYRPPVNTTVTVTFRDESGRFSLSDADFNLLRLVFDEMGFNRAVSEELADSLLDWMDEDDLSRLNGFDGDDYDDLDPPYRPTNGPLRSWDELALIPAFQEHFWDENGVPLPALARFRETFTLREVKPLNLNAAPELVRRALDEMGVIDERNLAEYKAGPDREPGTADDRVLRDLSDGGVALDTQGRIGGTSISPAEMVAGTTISLLEISVEVQRGEAVFLLRSLVSYRGTQTTTSAGERAVAETTPAARSDGEQDEDRRARGSARTQTATGDGASLGYPFQIISLVENRQI